MTARRADAEPAVATLPTRVGGHRRRRLRALFVGGVLVGCGVLAWGAWPAEPAPAPLPARTFERAWDGVRPAPGDAQPPSPPYSADRLLIPSIGVDARVVPETIDASGELVIPEDPGVVGRWIDGPELGALAGTTLLAGHVDVAGAHRRPGALIGLSDLEPGAWIVTADARGRGWTWRVDSLVVTRKDQLPTFPREGERRLAIVTCGGPLLSAPSGNTYQDNVIAFAVPASP